MYPWIKLQDNFSANTVLICLSRCNKFKPFFTTEFSGRLKIKYIIFLQTSLQDFTVEIFQMEFTSQKYSWERANRCKENSCSRRMLVVPQLFNIAVNEFDAELFVSRTKCFRKLKWISESFFASVRFLRLVHENPERVGARHSRRFQNECREVIVGIRCVDWYLPLIFYWLFTDCYPPLSVASWMFNYLISLRAIFSLQTSTHVAFL